MGWSFIFRRKPGLSSKVLHPVLAFFSCSLAAVLAIVLFRGTPYATTVPLFFLIFAGTALRWGHVGTIAGLVCAALLFALSFPPIGSLVVASEAARANLGWMLLLGIPIAFLAAPAPQQDQPRRARKQ